MASLSQFFGDAVASGQSEHLTDPRQFPAVYARYTGIKTRAQTLRNSYEIYFWDAMNAYMNSYNEEDSVQFGGDIDLPNRNWNVGTVDRRYGDIADPAFFDTRRRGNVVKIEDSDIGNWVEICNVTGSSGYLAWVLSPAQKGVVVSSTLKPTTGIKIIVDGLEYEFTAQHLYYDGSTTLHRGRLAWGTIQPGTGTGSWAPGINTVGAYEDIGTDRDNHNGSIGYGHNGVLYNTVGQYQLKNPWAQGGVYSGHSGLRFENSVQCFVKNDGLGVTTQSTSEYSNYAAAAWTFDYTLPGY